MQEGADSDADSPGCDSSAFDSWGYIIICTRDWMR